MRIAPRLWDVIWPYSAVPPSSKPSVWSSVAPTTNSAGPNCGPFGAADDAPIDTSAANATRVRRDLRTRSPLPLGGTNPLSPSGRTEGMGHPAHLYPTLGLFASQGVDKPS